MAERTPIPAEAIGRIVHSELRSPLFPELAGILTQHLFDHPLNIAKGKTLFVPRSLTMEKVKGVDTVIDPLDTTIQTKLSGRKKDTTPDQEAQYILGEFAKGHVEDLAAVVINGNSVGRVWTEENFRAGLLQATDNDLTHYRELHTSIHHRGDKGFTARIADKITILTDLQEALQPHQQTPQA